MVRKKNERTSEIKENMRGGTGRVKLEAYFSKEEMNANCRLCSQITVSPGASIGSHEHLKEEEIFIILRGTGVITDDGREYTVTAGDSILTGNGGTHSIRNDGDEDLEMVAVINCW